MSMEAEDKNLCRRRSFFGGSICLREKTLKKTTFISHLLVLTVLLKKFLTYRYEEDEVQRVEYIKEHTKQYSPSCMSRGETELINRRNQEQIVNIVRRSSSSSKGFKYSNNNNIEEETYEKIDPEFRIIHHIHSSNSYHEPGYTMAGYLNKIKHLFFKVAQYRKEVLKIICQEHLVGGKVQEEQFFTLYYDVVSDSAT